VKRGEGGRGIAAEGALRWRKTQNRGGHGSAPTERYFGAARPGGQMVGTETEKGKGTRGKGKKDTRVPYFTGANLVSGCKEPGFDAVNVTSKKKTKGSGLKGRKPSQRKKAGRSAEKKPQTFGIGLGSAHCRHRPKAKNGIPSPRQERPPRTAEITHHERRPTRKGIKGDQKVSVQRS